MEGGEVSDDKRPLIIVKRYRKVEGGHHGGAWKIAYADFVTAMMAFFLVMWLVSSINKQQRAAIFEYFKNPSMEPGKSVRPAPGVMGPGGASTSPINLQGGLDAPRINAASPTAQIGAGPLMSSAQPSRDHTEQPQSTPPSAPPDEKSTPQDQEHKRLEALLQQLREAIAKSQALKPFKDQLLIDIMPEGLRIQIVDAQNRPMFDVGRAQLKTYTVAILHELAPYLASVPNRISIIGHTDATPYAGVRGYTNWELSADRANAARRALVAAGMPENKINRIVGLADSAPINRAEPQSPINRRISIIVMNQELEAGPEGLPQPQQPRPAPVQQATSH